MSRGRIPATHVGPRPEGVLTLEEAQKLPVFAGQSGETIRRRIKSARVGFWKPDGSRGSSAIYAADGVRAIAWSLAEPSASHRETASPRLAPKRLPSKLPHGARDGWATANEIQLLLHNHGIDGTYFPGRWLRERLLVLGVPSERRVVAVRTERVFPIEQAVAALKKDWLVKSRIGW